MSPRTPIRFSFSEAFTLLELLLVMALLILIMTLVPPAFMKMARISSLSTAGQSLVDMLNLARQTAMTRSLNVEMRFYQFGTAKNPTDKACRACQLFLVKYDGSLQPCDRVVWFPEPVIISDSKMQLPHTSSVSSLLAPTNASGDPTTDTAHQTFVSGTIAGQYVSFLFRPTGETNLDPGKSWFMTLILDGAPIVSNNLPANYLTVWVDPCTGKVTVFRP